jgi:hypothetical protein
MRSRRRVVRASRYRQAALRVPENDLYLITSYTGEPRQEIVDPSAVFEILEKRSDRHARAFEQPFAADLPRDALHRTTLIPIEHDAILFAPVVMGNHEQAQTRH